MMKERKGMTDFLVVRLRCGDRGDGDVERFVAGARVMGSVVKWVDVDEIVDCGGI